jgi:hypothetical protein
VVQELHAVGEQDLQHELAFLLATTQFDVFCELLKEYSSVDDGDASTTAGMLEGGELEGGVGGDGGEQPEWT